MEERIPAAVTDILAANLGHKCQNERLSELLYMILSSDANESEVCRGVFKLAETVVNYESVSMVVARQFISDILLALDSLSSPTLVKGIASFVLETINSRHISYEEQVVDLRFKLANYYETVGDCKRAVEILTAIPLETGQRTYTPALRARTYLRIAQLALDYDDVAEAETYVSRASMLMNNAKHDDQLNVTYKVQYARMLDHRKKFIEAAQRYYELSLSLLLTVSEKLDVLSNAISCSILASSGAHRSRMLTTLYKDERCEALPAYGVLKKLHLERLIKNEELMEFEKSLSPHQRDTHEGWSVLQRAIVEHNLIAVSKIFSIIAFDELAGLLDVDVKQAEKMAWQMLLDGRMGGHIDQTDGYIFFKPYAMEASVPPGREELADCDQHIVDLCQHVNDIASMIVESRKGWSNTPLASFSKRGYR